MTQPKTLYGGSVPSQHIEALDKDLSLYTPNHERGFDIIALVGIVIGSLIVGVGVKNPLDNPTRWVDPSDQIVACATATLEDRGITATEVYESLSDCGAPSLYNISPNRYEELIARVYNERETQG